MTREEHIYQLKQYLQGKSISMCPSSSLYWREHWEEVIKALEQEPTNTIDYRRAFKIACDLLNGDILYGVDTDKIYELMMKKDEVVSSSSYEEYILNHLQDLDQGQYANEPTTKNDLGVDKLLAGCEKMSFEIEIFNKPLRVVALDAVKNIVKDLFSVTPQESTDKCRWIKYDYRTMCPKEHIDVDNPYWRIPENRMDALKYCPYCGKEIEVEECQEKNK